ncbi:gamma carbonic anhydrase family protein [Accumulibacter sp.]|jgi:carbonic anhydrase/acetyltransferase-like protein (isoleucine patch superfamily)|uniref:gamma carbonic anhydrase family protein n=1 Tax=Accumulibacter sp. TaxID=2053492 RepID=UPI001AC0D59E|nr:gamma carbonic anhydrase family protein [Accumulibacter sp.]MBN8455820.1 gamma carbonic anhydrase family protein [Accumulibacter sp.]MBO3706462.1 gamma carbonic anhydrase family protein [Candidatus Accumulibacter conexus]
MPIYLLGSRRPQLDPQSWVAPNAIVIGDVRLAKNASIWWNATLRGDNDPISIGEDSNIQDHCVLHTDEGVPLTIGREVTVGHLVMLHGCTIGDGSLIGIGSVLLNRAVIGEGCIVGANTLIPEGKVFPDHSLIVGSPGKVVRQLDAEQVARIRLSAAHYVDNWQRYQRELQAI